MSTKEYILHILLDGFSDGGRRAAFLYLRQALPSTHVSLIITIGVWGNFVVIFKKAF